MGRITGRTRCPRRLEQQTFRLGNELVVRLPSAERYVAETEKEQRWLPILARKLPLPVPEVVARGGAGENYPWPWSVYRWIDGTPAEKGPIRDMAAFAGDLGAFLVALRQVETHNAPPAAFLDASDRAALRQTVGLDAAAWARGRGWTLWKALIVMAGRKDAAQDGWAERVLEEIIADFLREH